jgi:outer membrane protein OmpA-like peptidoglycan-associated protein
MNRIARWTTLMILTPALLIAPLGCETMSEHKTATGAAIGTVTGAVIGGVIGHQSGHRTGGAAIGAGVGAALGAGAGYWLDRRTQRLNSVRDQATTVESYPAGEYPTTNGQEYVPEHIVLRLSDWMVFNKDSSSISPEGTRKLNEIAGILEENPRERIIIRGYASTEGADMVAKHLIGRGLNPARIIALGMGASNPIADNATEAGRAQNRRVEIEIFPPEA